MAQVWTWLQPHVPLSMTGKAVNAYFTWDLAALGLPANTQAVLLSLHNTNNTATLQIAVRPNTMAWERYDGQRANSMSYYYCKVIGGRIDVKVASDTAPSLNVVAYAAFDSPTIWFDNPINLLSQSVANTYSNIDITPHLGGRAATAAFVRMRGADTQQMDWRHPASVAQHKTSMGGISLFIASFAMIGCQANQFSFFRLNSEASDQLELLGFATAGVAWNVSSQPNLNPVAAATWETFSVGNPDAVGCVVRGGRTTASNANTIGHRGNATRPLAAFRNPTFPGLRHAQQYVIWNDPAGTIDTYRTTSDGANSFFDVEATFNTVTAQASAMAIPPLTILGG